MSLARRRPMERDRRTLLEQMNQLMGEMLPGADDVGEMGAWSPSVNVYDQEEVLTVEAELPGVEKKDIHVVVENGVLTLSGERRHEEEVKDEDFYRCERSFGMFHRSFALPATVDTDKIKATVKDGVLKLTLPKSDTAKGTEVEVH